MTALAHRRVLVLNKSWQAVGVVSIQRAITMLFSWYDATHSRPSEPKALIVDPESFSTFSWEDWSAIKPKDDEDYIQGTKTIFRIPEVIVLSRYEKTPTHRVTFSRRTLYKRDNYQCQYCGSTPGTEELTVDHIVPRSKGGLTTWLNCCIACVGCNTKKANRSLDECGMKLLRKTYKPKYQLFKGEIPCNSWKSFISEAYWTVPLENDNE